MNKVSVMKINLRKKKKHSFPTCSPNELDCQPQVSNAASPISFDQYVLTLQIPVGNGRLALGAKDLCMEVAETRH